MLNLNKQLHSSIHTNKLIIDITNEDYDKMIYIINTLENKYQEELKYYQETKEKSLTNIHNHSKLIKKIINDVLKSYDIIKKYKVCVFLTGSFARITNKKNSDIDLHFAYPQIYKEELFKYEEIIYYIISQILNLKRSTIHSMLITRLSRDNINYLETNLDDKELTVTLKNQSKNITYKYSSNTKRRIYLQYGNNNSLEEIFKYLKYEVENNNKEWAHIFYVFTQKDIFNKYYNELYRYEIKILNNQKIIKRINRIKEKISYINDSLLEIDKTNISQIKLIYQKKEFALINEYISLKRDLVLINNQEWKYINYYNNQKYLNKDTNFNDLLNYMYTIFELAEPLGSNYSLHSNKIINIENYQRLENSIKEINYKILTSIKKKESELNGTNNYNNADSSI